MPLKKVVKKHILARWFESVDELLVELNERGWELSKPRVVSQLATKFK